MLPAGSHGAGGRTMTSAELTKLAGEVLRDKGMALGARKNEHAIKAAQLALLKAIRRTPERTATIDATIDDPAAKYRDRAPWRGSVPRKLALDGLIVRDGMAKSKRVHRHAGYNALWRGVDDTAIDCRIAELRHWLTVNTPPAQTPEVNNETLFDNQNRTPGDDTPSAPDKNERHLFNV